MTSPYTTLVATCEQIANDPQLPGFIVDWADELYPRLINHHALISSQDLQLLSAYADDAHVGVFLINAALARR